MTIILKRYFAILLLLLVGSSCWGDTNGHALLRTCQAYHEVAQVPVNSLVNAYNAGTCAGFIAGVWFTDKGTCAPAGTTTKQAIQVFEDFARANPELLDKPAGEIVQWSLWKAWPCRSQAGQKK